MGTDRLPPAAPGDPGSAPDPFGVARAAATELARRTGAPRHDVAVVLGTGLAPAARVLGAVGDPVAVDDLPGFRRFTGAGHRAAVWSVPADGRRLLLFAGRPHLYEGHGPADVAHPVRTAVAAGCSTVVLTASVGSLRAELGPGDLALVADHLNLTGRSPLTGLAADDPAGHPFVDLTDAWSPELRARSRQVDPTLVEAVLAQMPGPHLETPAEIRMLATLGADLVGMSSVLEAIAARHLGAAVLGIGVVGNAAAGLGEGPIDLGAIHRAGDRAAERLGDLVGQVLRPVSR